MRDTTRRDRRLLELMNDPRHQYVYATRARRRGLVAAHVVLTAAALAAAAFLWSPEPRWAALAVLAVLAVLTAAWCVATGMLNLATRGLLELRGRVLDERQRADRGRVFVLAHRASLGLHLAALLWLLLAFGDGNGDGISVRILVGTVLVLLVAHWLLPLWVAALTARDAPAEDD